MDKLSEKEKAYVTEVKKASNSFAVPKAKAEEAWSRGINFISRFSGMKIQSSSDYHVETFHPKDINKDDNETKPTGYKLNKILSGEKVTFQIECLHSFTSPKYTKEVCKTNEQLLSHYMKKAELMPQFVDKSFYGYPKNKK